MDDGAQQLVNTSARLGEEIYELATELFPIARSITGPGVRDTLGVLSRRLPIEVH
ncbi:DUF4910 domain-containing protein, partial [Mesorhizobium sp. M00.F.Ca.ET.149.01.1.1]